MNHVLVPEAQLIGGDEIIEQVLKPKNKNLIWKELDHALQRALGRHLLFLDVDALRQLGLSELAQVDKFYNSYYWILVFSKGYLVKFGQNGGIKQYVWKVLEGGPGETNFEVVEELTLRVGLEAVV